MQQFADFLYYDATSQNTLLTGPKLMNPFQTIEKSLRSPEKQMNISITLIDHHGVFHDPGDHGVLPHRRITHQKNEVCKLGFCYKRCVGHCRFEVLEEAQSNARDYFIHECWKGLTEVVVPLRQSDILYGVLYAGIWRIPGSDKPLQIESLPPSIERAYAKLDELNPRHAHQIGRALTLVAKGIVGTLTELTLPSSLHENRRNLIKHFIWQHAATKPKLKDLARKLGISVSRTSHVVKEIFGSSFEELILNERMNRAKYLLQTTDLPIGKIASLTGFPDTFSFSKLFNRTMSHPPSQYRKSSSR